MTPSKDHGQDAAALVARPFLVESYEDWSDYPGWSEVTTDEDEPIRFATVAEAQEWIEAQCAADIAERLAHWEQARQKHEARVALHERRLAVLEAAGLGTSEKGYGVLMTPGTLYAKPTADRSKYRVAFDGDPCPTCGVRGYGNRADEQRAASGQECCAAAAPNHTPLCPVAGRYAVKQAGASEQGASDV